MSKAMLEDIKAADLEKEKADDNSDLAGEKDERKLWPAIRFLPLAAASGC